VVFWLYWKKVVFWWPESQLAEKRVFGTIGWVIAMLWKSRKNLARPVIVRVSRIEREFAIDRVIELVVVPIPIVQVDPLMHVAMGY